VNAQDKVEVHCTHCPVPTAKGIGLAKHIFDALCANTIYRFRDILELGPESAEAHYTHSIASFFREGGEAPPLWARARGADSQLLGVTFMQELLGIFVRADDAAPSVVDLAGRRIGLPVWPSLVFDFWRFAAEKGFHSALARQGLRDTDVESIDVVENAESNRKHNGDNKDGDPGSLVYGYRRQLEALLEHRVDAIFGKGAEAAVLEREAGGRTRLLHDIRSSPNIDDRVNARGGTKTRGPNHEPGRRNHVGLNVEASPHRLRVPNFAPRTEKESVFLHRRINIIDGVP